MSILHFHFVYKAKPCIYHGPYFFMSFVMQFIWNMSDSLSMFDRMGVQQAFPEF